ncbi:RHS repeat-associated core domain-containing protein [Compostibacter hankyongensis]|uniref:RHS repeat-associated core domain-containing protein n=1 Tax=Compostibacter hankyongensis TaxID=1007089 RepID=A0ABP8FZT9_9BACT
MSPAKTTRTDYLSGFVYQQDTLQFFPTEEGRVRYEPAHGSTASTYYYDYFIKDHLGNTRVVLTDQTDFSQYMATMEPQNTAQENALFYNIDQTRTTKPQGYPEDETTTPNTAVARLNAREPDRRIGPSIILKVMAGDTIQAAARAYYHQQGTDPDNPSIPAEEMVSSLIAALPGLAGPTDPGHQANALISNQSQGPRFTANDLQQLKQKDTKNLNAQKPRAYLNYVFFDNQLNFVEEGSGVKQVQAEPDELETLSSGQVIAKKSGYVYVYTSNESQQDVFFDNVVVEDLASPMLEETHYYPFGLTMAGISQTRVAKLENKFRYNGKELQNKEFSDESGLDIYTAQFRSLDPQIGRWWQIDPEVETLASLSPYHSNFNNPVNFSDPYGDFPIGPISPFAFFNGIQHIWNKIENKIESIFNHGLYFERNLPEVVITDKRPLYPKYTSSSWHKAENLYRRFTTNGFYLVGNRAISEISQEINTFDNSFTSQIHPLPPDGEIRPYEPDFFDNWSESNNALLQSTYSSVDNLWITLENFNPVKGHIQHLNGSLANNNERVDAFGGATADITTTIIGERLFAELGVLIKARFAVKGGTTVLGHYPEYINLASKINAKRFNIPTKVWEGMTDVQRWAANQKFLDRMILRGDNIRLATPLNRVKPGSYYQKELNYLFEKGYKVSSDGLWLVK